MAHKISQTQQRAYLYLALALLIAALLIAWPKPESAVFVESEVDTVCVDTANSSWHSAADNKAGGGGRKEHLVSVGIGDNDIDTAYRNNYLPQPKRGKLIVDINTADTLTLQLLHGIGPVYADRIVRYRQKLGGFTSVSQLLEVYGLTAEVLDRIAANLVLSADSIRRMDINTVSLKQLARHPYVDYYQARDIIALRNKGLHFSSPSDLLAVPSMTDSAAARLLPYLVFE